MMELLSFVKSVAVLVFASCLYQAQCSQDVAESLGGQSCTPSQTSHSIPTHTIQIFNSVPTAEQPSPLGGSGHINDAACEELRSLAAEQIRLSNVIISSLNDSSQPMLSKEGQNDGRRPRDCSDVLAAGINRSGLHAVYPSDQEDPFFVFCDMETDGGGWTMFQRRQNGTVDFYQKWLDYKYGFGRLTGEHWLGNEKLHRLTTQRAYELRIDLTDWEGGTRYAKYHYVNLAGEEDFYRITLGVYSGTAGDSMTSRHQGMSFTTYDADHDTNPTLDYNCAVVYKGAWWHKDCHKANLNGLYHEGGNGSTFGEGINWHSWKGYEYSLKATEMKIRPPNQD